MGSRRCPSISISIEVVAVLAAALVLPAAADAHAFLTRSDPSSGAVLAQAPRKVTLFFDEGARVDGRPVWVVSFLDATTPAWFTVWIDRSTYRTLRLEMIATAHFMHDRDGPCDAPLRVEPPK